MIRRFPFVWAPAVVAAPAAAVEAVVWTKLSFGAQTWTEVSAGVLPRFQHIYPQEADATFVWNKVEAP